MKAYRGLFLLLILLVHPSALHAQSAAEGAVGGVVTDSSSRAPLENATVLLRSRVDSTRVVRTVTGPDGRFSFVHVPFGAYVVECGLLGHVSHRTPVFAVDATSPTVTLGTIALRGSTLMLEEVEVRSGRNLFSHGVDRKVYNVDQDLTATMSTASELLQKVPSVSVDIDGNVSLRGSSDVTILVNGKKSALMGRGRADALQQLPASGIERIEVITNPSARFTPEGSAGIINIVMKRGAGPTLAGDATVNVGSEDRHNENLSVSGSTGRLELFGNFSNRDDLRKRIGADDRLLGSAGTATSYDEDSDLATRPRVHLGNAGLTFHATPKDAWELSVDYLHRRPSRDGVSTIVTRNGSGGLLTAYDRMQTGYELQREATITSAFQHDFSQQEHTLRVEASFADVPQSEATNFLEHWSAPRQPDPAHDILFQQGERQIHLTADYARPGKDSKLESGYALDVLRQDIHSDAESLDVGRQVFVPDPARTYRFKLEQTVQALYTTYQRDLARMDVLLGLRAEYALVSSDLVTGGAQFTDRYPGLFPTLHVGYKTGSQSELKLSYSRRIRRPESDDLNPFPEFTDPYNMDAGNPHLRPESTHSLELGYQWRTAHLSLVPSIYYRSKTDGFTRVTVALTDTTFLRTMANLARDQSAGFEPVVTLSLGPTFQANLSANVFHEQIDATNLGYSGTRTVNSWNGSGNVTLTPLPTTTLQATAVYRSARLTPQGDGRPSFLLNVGARRNLFRDRISLTLAASDVLKTQRQETELDVAGIQQHVLTLRDSQIIYAGFTYHFGRSENKPKAMPFEEQP